MLNYIVKVGAYFECRTKMVEKETEFRGCPSESCRRYNLNLNIEANFCSECGSKIADLRNKSLVVEVDSDQIQKDSQLNLAKCESFGDLFSPKQVGTEVVHRYTSNTKVGNHTFAPYQMETYVLDITHNQIVEDKENLHDQHRADLSLLRRTYGFDNVDIKWGVLFIDY